MRRAIRYLIISALAALILTGATFFVSEDVLARVPGDSHDSWAGATVQGFPIPYLTTFCCSIADGIYLFNASYYSGSNLAADLGIWFLISVAAVSTFVLRRFVAAAALGAGVTLLTLLARPISFVAPGYGAETHVLRPMGFPYEFLTYYETGLPGLPTAATSSITKPPLLIMRCGRGSCSQS
jgi:hypothetical protein